MKQVFQLALLGTYGTKTVLERAGSFRIPRSWDVSGDESDRGLLDDSAHVLSRSPALSLSLPLSPSFSLFLSFSLPGSFARSFRLFMSLSLITLSLTHTHFRFDPARTPPQTPNTDPQPRTANQVRASFRMWASAPDLHKGLDLGPLPLFEPGLLPLESPTCLKGATTPDPQLKSKPQTPDLQPEP